MFQKYLFIATLILGGCLHANFAEGGTLRGRCNVAVTVHGGKKFALLKCDRADRPGDFIIRSMVWEKDDAKAFKKMARFSGRRFTCDLTTGTTARRGPMDFTSYKLSKCR